MNYIQLDKKQLLYPLPEFNYNKDEKTRLQVMIAGGAIRDSLFGEEFSDIDVFGLTKEDLDQFVKQNLTQQQGFKQVYFNKNLQTYKKGKVKVQIIYREYKSFSDILDEFDFTVCQFGYDGEVVVCNPQAILDVHHKRIVINHLRNEYVFDTVRRVQKYIQKGYTICNGGIKEILDKTRELTQQEFDDNIEYYPNTEEVRIMRFD